MRTMRVLVIAVLCLMAIVLTAQTTTSGTSSATSAAVPRLIRFSGKISGVSGTVGATFALYTEQTGGTPLWLETQNVTPDANGRYTVLLGSNSANGVPVELFTAAEAHWLGVQPEGQAEQARVLLVSVPYALKASDADTLGGKPVSAFMLTDGTTASTASTTESSGNYVQSASTLGSHPTPRWGPPDTWPNLSARQT